MRLTLCDIQILFLLVLEFQFTQVAALPAIGSFVFEWRVFQTPQTQSQNVRTAQVGMKARSERKRWEAELHSDVDSDPSLDLPEAPVLCTRSATLSCFG